MRSLRYLNTVLTIIALLLTLQLWTIWTAPSATMPATGFDLSFTAAREAHAQPAVQPAEQRLRMIRLLESIDRGITAQNNLLKSGEVRVRIDNIDALEPRRNNDDE